MSGNIYDTKIDKVKEEVDKLQYDLEHIKEIGEYINDYEVTLQKRYKYLYKTSNSLFKFVYDNYKTNTFNKKSPTFLRLGFLHFTT